MCGLYCTIQAGIYRMETRFQTRISKDAPLNSLEMYKLCTLSLFNIIFKIVYEIIYLMTAIERDILLQ